MLKNAKNRVAQPPSMCGPCTVLALALMILSSTAQAGQIHWKTEVFDTSQKNPQQIEAFFDTLADRTEARHLVIQFSEPILPAQRNELEDAGLTLLRCVGNNAFFAVASPESLNPTALSNIPFILEAHNIRLSWKLHPMLANDEVPWWAVVGAKTKNADEPKGGQSPQGRRSTQEDPIVGAYVLFHGDVAANTEGRAVAHHYNAVIRAELNIVNGLVIELPMSQIKPLADEDIVQWIEPPLPRMGEVNNSNRIITQADTVQDPEGPYGLDGSGVTVLVYDGGYGLSSHQDFGGRLTVRDSSGLSDHSTHVAGTVGGSGAASSGLYRGMAPGVIIESYGFEYDSTGIFLYTNPGDIETDYAEAINVYGADISNNSIGTNTETNGFDCAIQGDYGVTSALIDSIVRGEVSNGEPFRIVWANGNERQGSRCDVEGYGDYYSTAPPAGAKNHITVGALNSNDDSMTYFSSWGPVDDGRLKPDVSGPGCQSDDDGGVTSCSSSGGYTQKCGTSMASPTVCGLSALLLQDFRDLYPGEPDFRNSTLKILWAHTAEDLGNPGPDYQFGYGSVRAQRAVDLLRSENFLEETVDQGETFSVLVVVNPGDGELKVTLAWDDPPGTPNVSPALVNDLDLRVFNAQNDQFFPWTLDPGNPSAAAIQSQEDHVNNIEQVFIATPPPGAYRIEVYGSNVPDGPQPFSVCASPSLVNCSSAGIITLDRVKYGCSSTATIQVVDCDLNTDPNSVQTISVTIDSDSEPTGETVLLTETAPPTAAFAGSIPLSTTDAAGVLLIASGDLVTATYIDADDGAGGTNVTVVATALVDCAPPEINNVQTTNIEARSVRITFDTDEPAAATVRYGVSCEALVESVSPAGFRLAHSVGLDGLHDNTTYYYTVEAEDEAGNSSLDDNDGSCYSFTTLEIPDFFTELFESANDLDNLSLQFTPNDSVDYYAGCAESITQLPTDPNGGTVLSLTDDSYATVTLSGGEVVWLHGVSYGTFYVGSNGYVTFGSGDSDYDESVIEHFALPRISGLYDDLDPYQAGTLSWMQLTDRAVVTWRGVVEHNTSNANTFQIEMYFDGMIRISYLDLASDDGLAGLSDGTGMDPDFSMSDLSALGNCGPRPPVASSAQVDTPVNHSVPITLSASDDGLPDPPAALIYIITSLPQHGALTDPSAGAIGAVPYTLVGGGNLVVYAPDTGYGGSDSLQFKANDGGTAPEGGDSNIATVSITVGGPELVHSFPMDEDPGWSIEGLWAFGQPTGGGGQYGAPDPTSGYTGNNVYGYNLNGDYENNLSEQHLTSTAIDCSNLTLVTVKFWRWLGVERSQYDHANVQVSNDGGTWTTLWQNPNSAIEDSSWSLQEFDISSIADGETTVYLRWTMGTTDASAQYCGWNLDDVEVWGLVSYVPPMAGDCDGDGDVDLQDFLAFQNCYSGPGAPLDPGCECVDFDDDGNVDLSDFLSFQTAFTGPGN